MEEIIARIEKEMEESKMMYIPEIGKIVIAHIRACPEDAVRVTADKTLKGCFAFLKARARKNQQGGCGVAGDSDVYDYYGFAGAITPAVAAIDKSQAHAEIKKANLSIDDLFD
jgi:hypothetical protein